MSRREVRTVHHPTFGPVPPWTTSRPFRLFLLVIYGGMALGIGVLWPVLAPSPFAWIADRLSRSARTWAILALLFGSLVGSVLFGYEAIFQHRLRRDDDASSDA